MELADLSRFQEAYYNLVDETEALVARNNLAEEEADNLSKFNAEILGHNNPAQRILYLDRIRRELAEVKQVSVFITGFFIHSQRTETTRVYPRPGHHVCSERRFTARSYDVQIHHSTRR